MLYRGRMPKRAEALEIEVGGRSVRVSNPAKVMFPAAGVTKEELVRYYVAVGDRMLAAVRDRPLTLRRYPDGVDGESFFQKRVPKGAPDWVQTAHIRFPSGRTADEVVPDRGRGASPGRPTSARWTFHPWPVSRTDVEHPDQLRIDLDPQPGTDFSRRGAGGPARARELLRRARHGGLAKTSGGRGVHIYVPIVPEWTFIQVRRAVIALGRELERRMPDAVTIELVEGGARGEDLHRLQPDGQGPDDRLRLLGPAASRRRPCPPRWTGTSLTDVAAVGLRRAHHARAVRGGRRPARRAHGPDARRSASTRCSSWPTADERDRGSGRPALSARLPEDAGRADAGPALPQEPAELVKPATRVTGHLAWPLRGGRGLAETEEIA